MLQYEILVLDNNISQIISTETLSWSWWWYL